MKYRYVVAFQLVGVVKPNADLEGATHELYSAQVRAWLTGDLDTLPSEVDEAAAIGSLLLTTVFCGKESEGTPEERLAQEIKALRYRRKQETDGTAFLVVQAEGNIPEFNPQPAREIAGYVLAIGDAPKNEIRSRHESAIQGLLAAIAVGSEHLCGIKKVADSVTFVREDGKPLYCYSLTGSASGYMQLPILKDTWANIPHDARILSRHQALVDAARLLTRSFAESRDPLLAFLSAWCGLEIFVNKNFKSYESGLLAKLSSGPSSPMPQRIIERIRSVMSDKYRLNDKFSVISGELADAGAEPDQIIFESIKLVRDKLLHGENISLTNLPTVEAQRLLRKYLLLHLRNNGM